MIGVLTFLSDWSTTFHGVLSVLAVICGLFAFQRLQIRNIPVGPKISEFFDAVRNKELIDKQLEWVSLYGRLFRVDRFGAGFLFPVTIYCADPPLIRKMHINENNLYRTPCRFGRSGNLLQASRSTFGRAIIGMIGDDWRWRKDHLLKEFRHSSMMNPSRELFEHIVKVGRELCDALLEAADTGKVIYMDIEFVRCTSRVVTFLIFGREIPIDPAAIRDSAFDQVNYLAHCLSVPAWLQWADFSGNSRELLRKKDIARKVFDNMIIPEVQLMLKEVSGEIQRAADRKPHSFLERMLQIEPRFYGQNIQTIADEVHLLMNAGFETTAHSMAFVTGIMASSCCQAAIYRVRSEASNAMEMTQDSEGEPTLRSIAASPLTRGLFCEAIRLYPIPSTIAGQTYEPVECTYQGNKYTIPANVSFVSLVKAAQLHPDYVGGSLPPEEVEPERWLSEPAKQPFLMAFNLGAHACPGRFLSLLEGHVFLLQIIDLNVDFSLAYDDEYEELWQRSFLPCEDNFLVRPALDMPMRIKRRRE